MNARNRWRAAAASFVAAATLWTVAAFVTDDELLPEARIIVAGANGSGFPDGADGMSEGDVNQDGILDLLVPYEQGNRLTLSLMATGCQVSGTVTIPTNNLVGPEDAVLADADEDGGLDALVASEGSTRVSVLYGPVPPQADSVFLTPANWTRVDLTESLGKRAMRVGLYDINADGVPEIVVGEKESDPCARRDFGYYELTGNPRTAADWNHVPIAQVGWVMQFYCLDFEPDGDLDCVISDKERTDCPVDTTVRGVRLFFNDGTTPTPGWTDEVIYNTNDVRWFDLDDYDEDGDIDIIGCRSNDTLSESFMLFNTAGDWSAWSNVAVPQPSNTGQCQHVVVTELDDDGDDDLVFSYSNAYGDVEGVVGLRNTGTRLSPVWERVTISGPIGSKYDNLVERDCGTGATSYCTTEQHYPDLNGPGLGAVCYIMEGA